MSSVMPFAFNAVELCVAIINEKPWARAREVRRALEYGKATKTANVVKQLCSKENYAHKCQLTGFVSETKPMDWPKDLKKCDTYTNEEGMYELLFSSQQEKAKDFRRHCCNVLFPHVRQQLTNKMKEDHQQTIEEKDATIALLTDDLQDRNNQIQAIQYENVALQAQKDVYQAELQKFQDPSKQEVQAKTTLSSLQGSIRHLPTINFMTFHTILQGCNDVKGMLN